MLRVESIRYNIEGHQEIHRGYVGTKIYLSIYIYIYIQIEGHWETW